MKKNKDISTNYTPVKTEDGSYTYYSKNFDENLHSTDGAESETKKYFTEENDLASLLGKEEINIFEVGFGLGLGFLATLEALKEYSGKLHFISCEIDPDLVDWFIENHDLGLSARNNEGLYEFENERFKLSIVIGDATTTVPKYFADTQIKIDRIFQDPFSPKKNPTLWTHEWFELLKSIAKDDGMFPWGPARL